MDILGIFIPKYHKITKYIKYFLPRNYLLYNKYMMCGEREYYLCVEKNNKLKYRAILRTTLEKETERRKMSHLITWTLVLRY